MRSVIATAVVGASVLLPAAAAQGRTPGQAESRTAGWTESRAQARFPICPQVIGLCTWAEADAEGPASMLQRPAPRLNPPVRSAKNQTGQTWCLYPRPSYAGRAVVLGSGSYTPGLGLTARSARPC
ncbi:peptidase inhibitor family I36 protein [Streptomyces klenkii]|uniref:peptidase inhibitor family I36 protein n=1 Tax=Streptomyces klenkii TaxID=1420899 RepID=UPI0036E3027A